MKFIILFFKILLKRNFLELYLKEEKLDSMFENTERIFADYDDNHQRLAAAILEVATAKKIIELSVKEAGKHGGLYQILRKEGLV